MGDTTVAAVECFCLLQCHFCSEVYNVAGGELKELISELNTEAA